MSSVAEMIVRMLVLALFGLGFVLPLQSGFFNLALAGQLVGGAVFGMIVATATGTTILGVLAAWFWMVLVHAIGAIARYRWNASEVMVTLLLSLAIPPVCDGVMTWYSPDPLLIRTPPLVGGSKFPSLAILCIAAAIPVAAWLVIRFTVLGYQALAMRANERTIRNEWRRVLVSISIGTLAAAAMTYGVFIDTFLSKARFTSGDYARDWFLAIVVGLTAFGRVWAVYVASVGVVLVESLVRHASSSWHWPETISWIVFGAAIAATAVITALRAREHAHV